MSKDFEFQERPLEPPKIYEHDDVPAYDNIASPSQEDGVDLSKFSDDNNDVYLSDIVDDTPYVQKSPEKKPAKKQSRAVKSFGNVKNTYIFFIIVVVFSVALAVYAVFCMNDILAITKTRSSVTVTLNEEVDSSSEMINILHDYDLIQCKTFCKIFAKIRASKIGPEYPAGVYYLNGKMGLEGMLMTLQGDTATSETVRLTFPEGLTVPEIIDKLAENEVCDRAALLSVINSTEFSYSLVAGLTADEHVPYRLEGFLFPDTYEFYIGENASSVISRFLEQMEEKYPQKYRERAKELGLTDYEVITIASIIQKEAGSSDQMADISSVIHNRLNNSTQFPSLGCESTGDYITNFVAEALESSSAEHSADYYMNYYSTMSSSLVSGLPAGPICNPGADAIEAALYPSDTNYYYFFHDADGELYCSSTASENRQKIQRYAPYLDF